MVWAFGHTHFNSDNIRGEGVRVVSNQCGYLLYEGKPADGFDPAKVISIKETEQMIADWLINSPYDCSTYD